VARHPRNGKAESLFGVTAHLVLHFWEHAMTKSWFWKKVSLNKDIDRHRAKEVELKEMISQLESKESLNEFEQSALRTYHNLLSQLMQSKAEVTSKIGRNKKDR
jgi:predicted 2-oxoglutarate/Fe(II)-dependent dioxygenase YbiX